MYKINCSDCHASYNGDIGRNLKTRLTEHKQALRKGDVNNHIAKHNRLTNHTIDWESAQCLTYSTDYFQRLTLESWFTNLEQTPLTSAQVVETLVTTTDNSISQDYTHPDDQTTLLQNHYCTSNDILTA